MKRIVKLAVAMVFALCYAPFMPMLSAQSYDDLWKQLQEAERKSLPQTVIEVADQIYEKALKEKNAGQLFKAYLTKENTQESLTPDSVYGRYARMEDWIKSEPEALNRAVLHSLLAEGYAVYMAGNSRGLRNRTDIEDEIPNDIREWTTNIFIEKIDAHVQASLEDESLLLNTKTDALFPFVYQNKGSDYFGHDFFHLLVKRGLSSYGRMRVEQAEKLREEREEALLLRLMKAYEKTNQDALVLAKLDYWSWCKNNRIDTSMEELDELIKNYGQSQLCCEVYLTKATRLNSEGRYAEADEVCDEGIARYPDYQRVNTLKNLKNEMYKPRVDVDFEQMIHPDAPLKLSVDYANVPGVTVYLYDAGVDQIPFDRNRDHILYDRMRLLKSEHFTFEEANIVGKEPFNSKQTNLTLAPLGKPAVYVVRVVADGQNEMEDVEYLASSRLRLITLKLGALTYELTTIDGMTGHPVGGVEVRLFSGASSYRDLIYRVITDADGRAQVTIKKNDYLHNYSLAKGDDKAYDDQSLVGFNSYFDSDYVKDDNEHTHVALLTDRSIYRPGQTIYIKGVVYRQKGREVQVKTDHRDEVILRDANGQEVGRQEVSVNEFGSFNTEMVLPTACLNGNFSITLMRSNDSTYIRVEEYKRPTFEIGFNSISGAYRIGDEVELTGYARMLNGISLQDVPVNYTVVRRERGRSWRPDREKPLLADSVKIDKNGNFAIKLRLQPDEKNPQVESYVFRVQVTVTDLAGETQEAATNVQASWQAYNLYSDIPSEIVKEDTLSFGFDVYNKDGEEQPPMKVRYTLYRIDSNTKNESSEVKVGEAIVNSGESLDFSSWKNYISARYRLEASLPAEDKMEERCRATHSEEFLLYSPQDKRLNTFKEVFCPKSYSNFGPGEEADILFGTSYQDAYVFMDIFQGNDRLESKVLNLNDELMHLHIPYKEEYKEGISVLLFFVKDGQSYSQMLTLRKKYPERGLKMKWNVFRDKLLPGQQEEWRLTIHDAQGHPAVAEMLALMYDESLDKIYSRGQSLNVSMPSYYRYLRRGFNSPDLVHLYLIGSLGWFSQYDMPRYDEFMQFFRKYYGDDEYEVMRSPRALGARGGRVLESVPMVEMVEEASVNDAMAKSASQAAVSMESEEDAERGALPEASDNLRTNFAETAFFYPVLRTNEQGEVVISFTIPESLTRWKFQGYAHTQDMQTGYIEDNSLTQKDFMLRPNMPRFLRVGDKTQIAATIQNTSDKKAAGEVSFILFNPVDEKIYSTQKAAFSVNADESGSVKFGFTVPENIDLMGIRIMAEAADFSDGEQHVLPVLSNKQYVIETVSMPVRGNQTRTFSLENLFNHHKESATQRRLTVEFSGNPAWYAVQALPSVGTPLRDNAIDWAIAYYVNSLASHIANSQPRIQQVFNRWKNTDAAKETFISQLQKNADLKEILLNESPWVLEAQSEADQRQRIATLFDLNQMRDKLSSSLVKLAELQNGDGGWSWYKGMRSSWYTTVFIMEQLARVPILTKTALPDRSKRMQEKGFGYLHSEAQRYYEDIQRWMKRDKYYEYKYLSSSMMDYLYMIAITGTEVPDRYRKEYDFFFERVQNNLVNGSLTIKAMSAVILNRAGETKKANEFIASLKEHLVMEDEMGAHFAFLDAPYAWGMMPIPSHVAVMEAFGEFAGNETLIEEMKIWLLKQKQTHAWSNSVATADAVYALLCTGADLLQNQGDVRITLGNEVIETLEPSKTIIPDLAYVKQTYTEGSSAVDAREAVVEKRDAGIAWGAVYAHFLSPMTDVEQQGGPLNVDRKFYVERKDAQGRKSLAQVGDKAKLRVGDMIVSRITISLDRSMDFVQLKDRLAACFEPLNALSGYRYSQGFGYYVENEDAATNFFFDALGKGVYVLESRYRISRAGTYQVGLALMQCAYAPEFTSHSSGLTIVVEE